jgi:hypothetical protein
MPTSGRRPSVASGDDVSTLWLPRQVMRQEAEVPSTTVAALEAVKGYMIPRYVDRLPDGRRVAELRADDLRRVEDGYGCGECLANFDQRFQNCPGCGHKLDANRDIVDFLPDYWKPGPSTIVSSDV